MSDHVVGGEVPLRDVPLDPLSRRDRLTALILSRVNNHDEITTLRLSHGWLSPKEVARIAAEVALELGVPEIPLEQGAEPPNV